MKSIKVKDSIASVFELILFFHLYGSPCCKKSFCSLAFAFAFNSFTTTLTPPGSVYISLRSTWMNKWSRKMEEKEEERWVLYRVWAFVSANLIWFTFLSYKRYIVFVPDQTSHFQSPGCNSSCDVPPGSLKMVLQRHKVQNYASCLQKYKVHKPLWCKTWPTAGTHALCLSV